MSWCTGTPRSDEGRSGAMCPGVCPGEATIRIPATTSSPSRTVRKRSSTDLRTSWTPGTMGAVHSAERDARSSSLQWSNSTSETTISASGKTTSPVSRSTSPPRWSGCAWVRMMVSMLSEGIPAAASIGSSRPLWRATGSSETSEIPDPASTRTRAAPVSITTGFDPRGCSSRGTRRSWRYGSRVPASTSKANSSVGRRKEPSLSTVTSTSPRRKR